MKKAMKEYNEYLKKPRDKARDEANDKARKEYDEFIKKVSAQQQSLNKKVETRQYNYILKRVIKEKQSVKHTIDMNIYMLTPKFYETKIVEKSNAYEYYFVSKKDDNHEYIVYISHINKTIIISPYSYNRGLKSSKDMIRMNGQKCNDSSVITSSYSWSAIGCLLNGFYDRKEYNYTIIFEFVYNLNGNLLSEKLIGTPEQYKIKTGKDFKLSDNFYKLHNMVKSIDKQINSILSPYIIKHVQIKVLIMMILQYYD